MVKVSLNLKEEEYKVLNKLADKNSIMFSTMIRLILSNFIKKDEILELNK